MRAFFFETALLPDGWARDVRAGADGGRFVTVEAGGDPTGAERIDVALPGLASLHSHAFQRGMSGLSEYRGASRDTFWTWRETMYRFALALDPDEAEAVAAMLYCEMLETGFTSVGEFHYLHHDRDGGDYADPAEMAGRIVAAADTAGIGLTLLPVYYRHGGFRAAPPHDGQRRFLCDPDRFARLVEATRNHLRGRDGTGFGLAPHSLRAAGLDDVRAVADLAGTGPVHIHVAEQTGEVEDCLATTGARPVELLLANAPVDERWCLVHSTHASPGEIAGIARAGATVGLCPVTEANLGDGIFDLTALESAGGRYGVGTDSNVSVDAALELRQLEYAQRLATRSRNVAAREGGSTGRRLVGQAVAAAAAVMGRGPSGLVPGAPADFVSLDLTNPHLVGRSGDRLLDGWIFGAGSPAVAGVWVGGRPVVSGGRHRARTAIASRYAAVMTRLVARLG